MKFKVPGCAHTCHTRHATSDSAHITQWPSSIVTNASCFPFSCKLILTSVEVKMTSVACLWVKEDLLDTDTSTMCQVLGLSVLIAKLFEWNASSKRQHFWTPVVRCGVLNCLNKTIPGKDIWLLLWPVDRSLFSCFMGYFYGTLKSKQTVPIWKL